MGGLSGRRATATDANFLRPHTEGGESLKEVSQSGVLPGANRGRPARGSKPSGRVSCVLLAGPQTLAREGSCFEVSGKTSPLLFKWRICLVAQGRGLAVGVAAPRLAPLLPEGPCTGSSGFSNWTPRPGREPQEDSVLGPAVSGWRGAGAASHRHSAQGGRERGRRGDERRSPPPFHRVPIFS